MTTAGRPSFTIATDRLRNKRKEAKLTQKGLAERVFAPAARKVGHADPTAATKSYQRIELKGRTSEKTARLIAKALGEALGQPSEQIFAFLCGGQPEAPPDRVQEIQNRLHEQLRSGANKALLSVLHRNRQSDQPDEDDICIEELTHRIAFQLETAQLEQRHEELANLAELTGWTVDELLRPTSLHGHWLLNTTTLVHREAATRETEILLGISDVLHRIEKHGTEWLGNRNESDARVELSEDAPWFRVTLSVSNWPVRQEFSFVRCAPSATGLQWVKPSEWDRSKLNGDQWGASELVAWAFQRANFVKGFKAGEQWPGDLERLRLWVRQRVTPENRETADEKDWWKSIAVHAGGLDECPTEVRNSFREEGNEHALVMSWLASGLWDNVLAPLLSSVPPDWWEIEAWGSRIRVATKALLPIHELSRHALEPKGRTFVIDLVEDAEVGKPRHAPWRLKDVQALAERLQNNLRACQEQVAIGPQRPRWITAA